MAKRTATRSKRSASRAKKRRDEIPGYTFDATKPKRVCDFLESVVTMTEGAKWAGKPMTLMPWQRDVIESIYGWVDDAGMRRYRRAAIWVPKKNGKSGLMAGLALYHMLADNEPGAFVALAACDRHQAGIIFRAIAASVRASPHLSRILEVIDSRSTIVHKASNSRIVAMSADSWRAEGINASAVIIDELHAHRKPDLVRALIYSGAARSQPLCVAISTAGDDRNGIGYEWWEDSLKVDPAHGGTPSVNPTFFGKIYCATDADDHSDPKVWKRANPSWGVTIDPKAFANEHKDASTSPNKLGSFLRYRLNVWSDMDRRFFDAAKWDACGAAPVDFAGRSVFVGVDIASNVDMTAAAFVTRDDDGTYSAMMRYWVPMESVNNRQRDTGLPYDQWIRDGYLTVTDGGRLDHEAVARDIVALSRDMHIVGIGADPWQVGPLATFLEREGLAVEVVRQNTGSMNAPSKFLEGLVAERRFRHGGHPILTFNAHNTLMYTDATGMVKPDKRQRKMIDGIVAVINALALAITAETVAESWDLAIL
jgi:phage terminase large subunit-like protein